MTTLNTTSFVTTGKALLELNQKHQNIRQFAEGIPSGDPLKAELEQFDQSVTALFNDFEVELHPDLIEKLKDISRQSSKLETSLQLRRTRH